MKKKFEIAVLTALLAAPLAAQAQGIPGGMERGAAEGNAAAGQLVVSSAARLVEQSAA
jgi:hypothetical protein